MGVLETYERSKNAVTLYAEWPLRIVFASIFMYHGLDKATGSVEGFAAFAGVSVGFAWLIVLFEILAGLLVFIGGFTFNGHWWFTRIGAAMAIPVMVGAIAKFHWPRWSFVPAEGFPMGGMEFQVTLILVAIYFFASTGRLHEHERIRSLPPDTDLDTRLRVAARNAPAMAHWALRIALASVFLYHGFTKFGTIDQFSDMMGLSVAASFIVAYMECAAGLLILVGGAQTVFADNASRVAGLLIVPIMLGAIVKVHGGRWDFGAAEGFPMGGAEFQTLLITMGLFFALRGRPAIGPIAQTHTAGA